MIDLKVSLNYSEYSYIDRAKSFDHFCTENYPNTDLVSEPLVMNWLRKDSEENSGTFHRKAAFTRALAAYQRSVGKDAYVLPTSFSSGRNTFVPYILTDEELTRLFHEIDTDQRKSNPFESTLMSVYFRLTYTCGLRPGESRNLRRCEVDLHSGEIRIVNSKWHKSRTIVMSEDMCALVRKYAAIRDVAFPESEYFFPNRKGDAYSATVMTTRLNKFFAMSYPEVPPDLLPAIRVYDLRHRFATAAMHRWIDQGVDLQSRLPYLQTYMGHKDLNATAYYIHLLPERLVASAGIDWEGMRCIFPKVELWVE